MSPETLNKFKEVEALIDQSECILIAGHSDSDGDSLGSILALHNAIRDNTGKKTIPYLAEEIPPSLKFLRAEEVFVSEIEDYPDLVIGVDYGDFKRLSLPEDKIKEAKFVAFDHHPKQNQKGEVQIIDTDTSSTTELVYEFLEAIDWDISPYSAMCILTGIVTDTGAFAHNSSSRTFNIVGELLAKGAPLHDIYFHSFADKPISALKAWGSLLQDIEFNEEYGYAGIYIPFEEFKKHGMVLDEFEGLKSILSTAHEAKFSVLVIEYEPGKIKGSFRSDRFKDMDVSRIASYLGGGGHKYAAAFRFEAESLEAAKNKIAKAIEEVLQPEAA